MKRATLICVAFGFLVGIGLIYLNHTETTPSTYICEQIGGTIIESNSSQPGNELKCAFQSTSSLAMVTRKIDDMIAEDSNFGCATDWSPADTESEYYARGILYYGDQNMIIQVRVPYQMEINHFYVSS